MIRQRATYTFCPRHPDGDPTCVMQDAAMRRVIYSNEPIRGESRVSLLLQIVAAAFVSTFFVWLLLVLLTSGVHYR